MIEKSKKPAVKTGRPSLFTEAMEEEIVARVAAGNDIAGICESVGISLATLHRWRELHPEFGEAYARGRSRSGEASESRIQRVMDDVRAGLIDANAARVLIDAEKWLAGKRAPRTHGDRVELEHSGSGGQAFQVAVIVRGHEPAPVEIEYGPGLLPKS